jgi:hypothetical protein
MEPANLAGESFTPS